MKTRRKIFKKVERSKYTPEQEDVVLDAVDKLVDFIKPTLGPKVKHILVHHGLRAEVRDDGRKAGEEMLDAFEDEFEDAVVKFVVEVLQRTDDLAGDGTTTAATYLQAVLREIRNSGKTFHTYSRELEQGFKEIEAHLEKKAKKIETEDDLYKVAYTSVLEEEAAQVVANTLFNVGAESAITIEKSYLPGITAERAEGFELPRGWISPYMVTDLEKQASVLLDPLVIVYDGILARQADVVKIFELAEKLEKRDIFIVATEFMGDALNLILYQKVAKNSFNTLCVKAPLAGEPLKEYLFDVAMVTNAKIIGGSSGISFNQLTAEYCGGAEKIIATREDTLIINGKGEKSVIDGHVANLKTLSEQSEDPGVKEGYFQRMARLLGGVAVIRVGAATPTELESRLDKIEDAVNACKGALEEGIIPGGGVALLDIETSSPILNAALKKPFEQILENAEIKVEGPFGPDETYDAITGTKGNYLELGVVDAVKVQKTALRNAISVATRLANVTGIVTLEREKNDCCGQA